MPSSGMSPRMLSGERMKSAPAAVSSLSRSGTRGSRSRAKARPSVRRDVTSSRMKPIRPGNVIQAQCFARPPCKTTTKKKRHAHFAEKSAVVASSRRIAALPVRHNAAVLDEARNAWDAGEYEQLMRTLEGARLDRREDRVAAAHWQARALLAVDRPEDVAPLLPRAAEEIKTAARKAKRCSTKRPRSRSARCRSSPPRSRTTAR